MNTFAGLLIIGFITLLFHRHRGFHCLLIYVVSHRPFNSSENWHCPLEEYSLPWMKQNTGDLWVTHQHCPETRASVRLFECVKTTAKRSSEKRVHSEYLLYSMLTCYPLKKQKKNNSQMHKISPAWYVGKGVPAHLSITWNILVNQAATLFQFSAWKIKVAGTLPTWRYRSEGGTVNFYLQIFVLLECLLFFL